jgi:DNA ligase-1
MRFDVLAGYFNQLEAASGRLEMYRIIADVLTSAGTPETDRIAYLCQARLLPAFTGVELGMGERMVTAAIAKVSNASVQKVERLYKRAGDLGLVAQLLFPTKRRSSLTVIEAHNALLKIARTSGEGSIDRKVMLLAGLIRRSSPLGARYLVRFAVGRLRLGVGPETVIEAAARTCSNPRDARAAIERAFNLCSDLGLVLKTLKQRGLEGIRRFKVQVGKPVRMMLAERVKTADAIISRLGRCAVESKLDGFRCQAHINDGRVEIFSRNLERTTPMFPDLVAAIRKQVRAKKVIVEGEAMALNESTGEFYPFQVTVQRKRIHNVDQMARSFPLALVVFDLLYASGRDYTSETYSVRRAKLEKVIKEDRRVRLVECTMVKSARELRRFFDKQLARGFEGIIAKRLDAPYSAGARNYNWIKLKRTYGTELSDTVDCVIVGYVRGRGMRARLGIGSLLAAVYNADSDSFQTVAKIGSGLSEENWLKFRRLLDKEKVLKKPARVESRITPDVWAEPKYVVTVLADEITRSPVHTTGRDSQGRGLALRFPRVVGFIRDDKSPEDATTVKEICEMYAMQRKHRRH